MSIDSHLCHSDETVSAIIVNYNAGALLTNCVHTILNQVDELFVIDNASSDASLELLATNFPAEPKLVVIRNNVNLGFASACNVGSQRSHGRYVLFLNPDCNADANVISELLDVLQSNDSVGMVGGLLLNPNGTEQGGSRRAVPTPWRSFVRAFGLSHFANRWPRLFFDFYLHKQPLPASPIEVEAISGACMLVKREAMDDVGLWDEAYFLHCEDLDWCMRFRQKKWKILFVPTARIVHFQGTCGRNRPIFVAWHKHKSMLRFYRKFFRHQYPAGLMWLVTLGVLLRLGLVIFGYMTKHMMRRLGIARG
ncbi:MAG TPA: glycosyltransferase family 2 protein [Rhodocyclaceae bacterium]|nr:glycosyltransferase family 2 protein [Rhodocyclaceae bacterium]